MQNVSAPDFQYPVREGVARAQAQAWNAIGRAGSWWSGAQRVEIARQARAARKARVDPPPLRKQLPDTEGRLPKDAVDVAWTIAADAHEVDRKWAKAKVEALGDADFRRGLGLEVFGGASNTDLEAPINTSSLEDGFPKLAL